MAGGSEPASASRPRPGMVVGSVFGRRGRASGRDRVSVGDTGADCGASSHPSGQERQSSAPGSAIRPHQALPSAVYRAACPPGASRYGCWQGAPGEGRGFVRDRGVSMMHGAPRLVAGVGMWRAMHHEGPGPAIDPPHPTLLSKSTRADRHRPANDHRRDLPASAPARARQSDGGHARLARRLVEPYPRVQEEVLGVFVTPGTHLSRARI